MENLILLAIWFIPLILWIFSIHLISEWKHFNKFFIANTILTITYLGLIIFTDLIVDYHDEYGLGRIITSLGALTVHIFCGFITSLVISRQMRKEE